MDSLSVDGGLLPAGATIRHQRTISMKTKSVKMAEYWGEQTQALRPFSASSRTKSRKEPRLSVELEKGNGNVCGEIQAANEGLLLNQQIMNRNELKFQV